MSAPCPCGTGLAYDACCGPLHAGVSDAPTAEALMRSRYSAFARADAGYLRATWHPSTRPGDVHPDPGVRWTRLRIVEVVGGGREDDSGVVEFRAHYRVGDDPHVLHERSTFTRFCGRWTYVEGHDPNGPDRLGPR